MAKRSEPTSWFSPSSPSSGKDCLTRSSACRGRPRPARSRVSSSPAITKRFSRWPCRASPAPSCGGRRRGSSVQVGRPERARKPEEVMRVIDIFIAQKGRQLAELGASDPFAAPEVASFLIELGLAGLDGEGGLVLHSLSKGGEI